MLAYLRRRAAEPLTWLGVALVAATGLALWRWRADAYQAGVAILGATLAALPDRLLGLVQIKALLNRFSPAASAASPQESIVMSAVSSTPTLAQSIFSSVSSQLETAAVSIAVQAIGASSLAPQAKQVFADITAARTSGSALSYIQAGLDTAQLVHDLLAQIETLKAAPAPATPSA